VGFWGRSSGSTASEGVHIEAACLWLWTPAAAIRCTKGYNG